jgi:hypothetical protein
VAGENRRNPFISLHLLFSPEWPSVGRHSFSMTNYLDPLVIAEAFALRVWNCSRRAATEQRLPLHAARFPPTLRRFLERIPGLRLLHA